MGVQAELSLEKRAQQTLLVAFEMSPGPSHSLVPRDCTQLRYSLSQNSLRLWGHVTPFWPMKHKQSLRSQEGPLTSGTWEPLQLLLAPSCLEEKPPLGTPKAMSWWMTASASRSQSGETEAGPWAASD